MIEAQTRRNDAAMLGKIIDEHMAILTKRISGILWMPRESETWLAEALAECGRNLVSQIDDSVGEHL